MKRPLRQLAERAFDLVIIGGGIYGATAAWDATLRGLSVALIDKADFGSGTSFNSAKTVHGGLRHLQHANLAAVRESIRERRAFLRIAPHLVHPLPFLVPTYRSLVRNRLALAAVLCVNDALGFDRNRFVDPAQQLPPSRLVSREECLRLCPWIDDRGVTGGAVWYDAQMTSSERLTLSFILSAVHRGAVAANYVEATALLRDGNRVKGVVARDALAAPGDTERFEVRAGLVLNAAGPWAGRLASRLNGRPDFPLPLSKAFNLVVSGLGQTCAVGGLTRQSRFLFMTPWRDRSIIGTSHADYDGGPDEWEATEADVTALLDEIAEAFPRIALGADQIALVHRGLVPRTDRPQIRDHRRDGVKGLISVSGVKYTTARAISERVIDRVFQALGRGTVASSSADTPLIGGDVEHFSTYLAEESQRRPGGLPVETARHLIATYGPAHGEVLAHLEENRSWAEPVAPSVPVIRAQIIHAVREELAQTLADVLLRRTDLGSAGHPGEVCVKNCAALMAAELGWDAARIAREIAAFNTFYAPLPPTFSVSAEC